MKRFKKILYVNEPSVADKSAPRRAVQLARSNNASLSVCDANPELPRTLVTLQDTYDQIHKQQLMQSFENADMEGVDSNTILLTGTPFIEVIREVQRGKHDLVIKSAEGSTGTLDNLFGVTDMHLMRKCPCPVWIFKPEKQEEHKCIVAAVDPDPNMEANAELNKLILELASSLAREECSELHIVHVWFLQNEDLLRSIGMGLESTEVDELVEETRVEHEKWLDELLSEYDLTDLTTKVHLIKGEPGSEIPKLVAKVEADLVVMGTVARTGIAGFFIGNTAEKILHSVDSSVLTVKPSSFQTPVR